MSTTLFLHHTEVEGMFRYTITWAKVKKKKYTAKNPSVLSDYVILHVHW